MSNINASLTFERTEPDGSKSTIKGLLNVNVSSLDFDYYLITTDIIHVRDFLKDFNGAVYDVIKVLPSFQLNNFYGNYAILKVMTKTEDFK